MNKRRLVISGLVAMLAAGGLWLSLRRQPSGSPLEEAASAFRVDTSGPGRLITYQDTQVPLRALRWIGPLPGGWLAAQVLTQSDRQQVAFFCNGQPAGQVLVTKPLGISEGYWRFAVLEAVLPLADGGAVLLYAPEKMAADDKAVAVAVDLATANVRWSHRGGFSRMALATGADPGIYFFGGKAPIQRLSLAAASQGNAGREGPNGAAKSLELPAEIPEVEDLLPTGGYSFLVSHRNGLSAYRGGKGWTHYPAPEDKGVACLDWRSSLVMAHKKIWWQALPGRLAQVQPDGTTLAEWAPEGWAPDDPQARDGKLLRLLGSDAGGALWFAVAAPAPAMPAAPAGQASGDSTMAAGAAAPLFARPAPVVAPESAVPAEVTPPVEDWPGYAAKGLDRVYRWDAGKKRLERFVWSQDWKAINPPPDLATPGAGQALLPGSGALLVEGTRSAWWLPLEALPFQGLAADQAR